MKDSDKHPVQKTRSTQMLESEGTVEFWNDEKKFGFIRLHTNNSVNAYCTQKTLEWSHLNEDLQVGEHVSVRYTVPSEVFMATVVNIKKLEPWSFHEGKVISFDVEKGYGFIKLHKRGFDNVYVSVGLLKALRVLPQDVYKKEVVVQIGPGKEHGQVQAVHLKLI